MIEVRKTFPALGQKLPVQMFWNESVFWYLSPLSCDEALFFGMSRFHQIVVLKTFFFASVELIAVGLDIWRNFTFGAVPAATGDAQQLLGVRE